MSRVQLALNVDDLDAAVDFYTALFDTGPAKRHEGYANFAISEPPLKLVLIEGGTPGTINHLGVEVSDTAAVSDATTRLADAGLLTRTEDEVTCCYAVQDKVWVAAPDAVDWEIYTVLADAPQMSPDGCCAPAETTDTTAATATTSASGGCC